MKIFIVYSITFCFIIIIFTKRYHPYPGCIERIVRFWFCVILRRRPIASRAEICKLSEVFSLFFLISTWHEANHRQPFIIFYV